MTVRLVPITLPTFRALADGDVATAEAQLGLAIPETFAESIDIWTFMIRLLTEQPANAGWAMQALVDGDDIVGNAGFKGVPVDGQAELGYRIVPERRRQGLAVAAVHALLDQARRTAGLDRVIARIDPDNLASVGVVTRAGFHPDGEHQHPRWGRQLQFAHATPAPPT